MKRAVVVSDLIKNFEVKKRKSGIGGAVSSLVKPEKKTVRALREVSFSIDEGELVGFIGPNGAGKTTTMKSLSGVLYPTSGFIQVLGHTPWDRSSKFLKQIALVMGQKNQLWWDLPASETFELNRAIYEIGEKKYQKNFEELVSLLEVKKYLDIPVRRLSLGQRMRLELVAALLHGPKVVFMDEPTIGLDVVAQQKVRDFIADYNRRNKATIILTSHNMDDLTGLVSRVMVIDEGKIIFDGKFSELVEKYAKEKLIKLTLSRHMNVKKLETVGKVSQVKMPEVTVAVPRGTVAVAASEILQGYPVADLTIEEESIDSVVRKIFKGEKG